MSSGDGHGRRVLPPLAVRLPWTICVEFPSRRHPSSPFSWQSPFERERGGERRVSEGGGRKRNTLASLPRPQICKLPTFSLAESPNINKAVCNSFLLLCLAAGLKLAEGWPAGRKEARRGRGKGRQRKGWQGTSLGRYLIRASPCVVGNFVTVTYSCT